jgi:hypothetical protein
MQLQGCYRVTVILHAHTAAMLRMTPRLSDRVALKGCNAMRVVAVGCQQASSAAALQLLVGNLYKQEGSAATTATATATVAASDRILHEG